jgi:hypothetical protein
MTAPSHYEREAMRMRPQELNISLVLKLAGADPPEPSGKEWQSVRCPFHNDTHGSGSVSYTLDRFICRASTCRLRSGKAYTPEELLPLARARSNDVAPIDDFTRRALPYSLDALTDVIHDDGFHSQIDPPGMPVEPVPLGTKPRKVPPEKRVPDCGTLTQDQAARGEVVPDPAITTPEQRKAAQRIVDSWIKAKLGPGHMERIGAAGNEPARAWEPVLAAAGVREQHGLREALECAYADYVRTTWPDAERFILAHVDERGRVHDIPKRGPDREKWYSMRATLAAVVWPYVRGRNYVFHAKRPTQRQKLPLSS